MCGFIIPIAPNFEWRTDGRRGRGDVRRHVPIDLASFVSQRSSVDAPSQWRLGASGIIRTVLPCCDNPGYDTRTIGNWVVFVCWPHCPSVGLRRVDPSRGPPSFIRIQSIRHKKNIIRPYTHLRLQTPVIILPTAIRRRLATVFRSTFTSVANPRPVCRRRLLRAQSRFLYFFFFYSRTNKKKKTKTQWKEIFKLTTVPLKLIADCLTITLRL